LLDKVLAAEDSDRRYWHETLKPEAEKLAALLTSETTDLRQAEREAVGIGVSAWQTGGVSCMRELRNMAIAICEQRNDNISVIDHISFWWDGIGNWRAVPLA
jgi:hypothetical protein